MARSPSKEAEVFALAQQMMSGLPANAAVYPSPPVTVAALGAAFGAYMTANNAAIAAPSGTLGPPSSSPPIPRGTGLARRALRGLGLLR